MKMIVSHARMSLAHIQVLDIALLDAQVAAGAAELYMRELTKITALNESGAAQLAADLDYFCNVLAALGVAVPLQLVTWQVKLSPLSSKLMGWIYFVLCSCWVCWWMSFYPECVVASMATLLNPKPMLHALHYFMLVSYTITVCPFAERI